MKQFFKNHSFGIVTFLTVVLILGFSYQVMRYFVNQRMKPEKIGRKEVVRHVKTQKVKYGTVVTSIVGSGRLIPMQDVVISSEVRGKILEGDAPFKKGETFKKNDTLIRIFDRDAVYKLKAQKSSFLQNLAGILPDLKVDYPKSYGKWMAFFTSTDMNKDLPELPEIAAEQEKIFLASRNILSEYYSIKSSEVTLDKYTIKAPFNGTFTDVSTEVGSIANPGSALAKIIRRDKLELEIPVETSDVRWIDIGDKVQVLTEDGTMEWKGTVVRKSGFVESSTQSLSIFVSISPTGEKPLYKGQYLKAIFNNKKVENVMEIPRNAVFNSNEVYVVETGKLVKKEITIHKIDEKTLIFSGLAEGTELVIEPLVNAFENMRVEILR